MKNRTTAAEVNRIYRNEHGYHCVVEGRNVGQHWTLAAAQGHMFDLGLRFEMLTHADSGAPSWWYASK